MNWDALGAISELASACGVIVTLLYLAIQIRAQNKENRLNAINVMTSQWNAFMGDMATNSGLARIWSIGLGTFDVLEPQEQVQLSTHFNRIFRIYESMYRQNQARRLDPQLWEGLTNSMADFAKSPGVRSWWPKRKHWYAKDFCLYVQKHIDEEGDPVLIYEKEEYGLPPGNRATHS